MARSAYSQNFFRVNEIMYNIAGIWLLNSNPVSNRRKCLQILYTLLVCIVTFTFLVLQLIVLREVARDLNDFFRHIGLLVSNSLGIAKSAFFVFHHNKIRKIVDKLHDKKYQYESLGEFNPGQIFLNEKKISQRCSILVFCTYTLVGIGAHISYVIKMQAYLNGKNDMSDHHNNCQDYIAFQFFFPVELKSKAECNIMFLWVDYSLCSFAWIAGSFDGFFVALLNCLKTHLIILRGAISTMRKRVLRKLQLNEHFEIFRDESLPILEEELYKELKHLTEHLSMILRTAKEMEDLFNLMLLAQTLSSLFNVASCLFSVTGVPVGSLEFFVSLQYFLSMLLELVVVCWFGSGITRASEEIMIGLYNCNWLSASRRFKKNLILTMCRMQRPIYLTIGKFFPLTLGAIVSVCKASYSYYTVFRKNDE